MTIAAVRTAILYLTVVLAVRLMGKRTVGELQASELVITLMISDLASVPMQETGIPLFSGIVPMTVLVILEIALSYLMLRFPRLSRLMCGSPVVVIESGRIVQEALRSLRMTNEDLFEALRKQSVFDVASVSCAVVETDGSLSVLLRSETQPPSAKDMGVAVPEAQIRALLVSDGTVERDSMRLVGWDAERIETTLRREKIPVEEVFIMTGTAGGEYSVIPRDGAEKRKEKGRRGT